jgi:hypothetical protein
MRKCQQVTYAMATLDFLAATILPLVCLRHQTRRLVPRPCIAIIALRLAPEIHCAATRASSQSFHVPPLQDP